METLDAIAESRIALLKAGHLERKLVPTRHGAGAVVERGGRTLASFACNDYLGLSKHPAVIAAALGALQFGAGAGASRLVSGNHPLYAELELLLASMKGTEAACVFGSGYLANIGTIPALADANDLILADRLVHACALDGAKLSGATIMRFAHNSVEHCSALLKAHRADFQHCLILTETVFSMDGDCAPVGALAALSKGYDAWLMTDDAHGLGIAASEEAKADIQMGTLSKAVGTYGGYVCANAQIIELLQNTARSLMFSTGLPPSVLASAIAALQIIRDDKKLCEKPLALARLFAQKFGKPKPESAIVPLVLGEAERALSASAMLEENGFYVGAIRPPTVPPNTSRLRFAFSALHTEQQVKQVAELLERHGYI